MKQLGDLIESPVLWMVLVFLLFPLAVRFIFG